MQIDTIRALFSQLTALVIIIGGGLFLYATYTTKDADGLTKGAVIAIVTLAANFVFSKEVATNASRSSERAFAAGTGSPAGPTA